MRPVLLSTNEIFAQKPDGSAVRPQPPTAQRTLSHGGLHHSPRDYARTPLNIYWEMTQACALACRHCRAEACPTAKPGELSFDEGVAFLRQILEFGEPMPQLILTGGDPLTRTDLYDHLFNEDDDTMSNLLDVHVSNIRKKLGHDFIATRRGHGYCIEG